MKYLKVAFFLVLFLQFSSYAAIGGTRGVRPYKYAVLMSKSTYNKAEWKKVADTLLSIHGKTDARLFTYDWSPSSVKSALSQFMPDYVAVVGIGATEINKTNVRASYNMIRNLDTDPYPDAVLGFVTGYNAADALRAATDTLRIKAGLHATPGKDLHISTGEVNKTPNVKYIDFEKDTLKGESIGNDRTLFLANLLNNGVEVNINGKQYKQPIDIFGTGGHGNVNLWQIHYPSASPEGYFKSSNGNLIADPYQGSNTQINKTTPTVYLSINNCLIGNPDNINNMAYAWFHSGRMVQMYGMIENCRGTMHGPTVRSRLKHAGFNATEAFFISEANLIWARETANDKSQNSTDHNIGHWPIWQIDHNLKDAIMYGDPKADVLWSEGNGKKYYIQGLDVEISDSLIDGTGESIFELKMTKNVAASETGKPRFGAPSWQRDERPVVPLPFRIDVSTIEILNNDTYDYDIADNVVLVDAWRSEDHGSPDGTEKILRWKAKAIDGDIVGVFEKQKSNTFKNLSVKLNSKTIKINFGENIDGEIELSILNAKGRMIINKKIENNAGIANLNLKLTNQISRGTYFLNISGVGKKIIKKIVQLN